MQQRGIDLLVLTARENISYFTGLATPEWVQKTVAPAVALISAESDEPTMVMPDFFLGMNEKITWVNDFVLHAKSHSNPLDFARLVASTIKERGWDHATIGYEGGPEMLLGVPLGQWNQIQADLSSAEWVDAGELIWGLRMIKSAAEVERLRHSSIANGLGVRKLRDFARAGMSELQLAAYLRREMIQDDVSEQDRMHLVMRAGPERYNMAGSYPHDRKIQNGDLLIIDLGIHHEGYASDTARVMSVGEPSALHVSVYEKVIEARKRALDILKPGTPACDVYNVVRSFYNECGFPAHIDMVGHGIGLDAHEPPTLATNNPTLLQENMVVCIEPWITLSDNQGVLTLEDTFVIRKDGWEALSIWDGPELWVIKN